MRVLRLKAIDEKSMIDALIKAGLPTKADGSLIKVSHKFSLIMIGELYKPTGKTVKDVEGNTVQELIKLDGFHANLTTENYPWIGKLADITLDVKTPIIKIAGES